MQPVPKNVSKARAVRRQGISRLPRVAPTRWRSGFPWHRLDWRSPEARFLAKFIGDLCSDLGGPEALTRAQIALVERSAFLALKVVQFESADLSPAVNVGPSWTWQDYAQATGHLRRLLCDIGLERRARDIPTVASYVAAKRREASA